MTKTNILIVEDEAIVAQEIKISLQNMGHSVASIASRGEEAIGKAEAIRPDLILMDIQLKGEMDGIEAANIIQSRFSIPVIFLTAYDDDERLKRAKSTLPYGYVLKPFRDRELRIAIEMALYAADMNARRQLAEEALQKSKELLEKTFESQIDAIFILNSESPPVILDCNLAAVQTFGYAREEMLNRPVTFLHVSKATQKEFQEKVYATVAEKGFFRLPEFKMKQKDGTLFPTEHSVAPLKDQQGDRIGWVSVIRDISDRKRTEAQARETHKMKAIAILAGGIAHEFNNALTGVTGNIDLLLMDAGNEEKVRKYSDAMRVSSHRMANLTHQLLAYARGGKYQPKATFMSDFIRDTLPIIGHSLNHNVSVETDLPEDISAVEADMAQLQMVLSALLANANEAIGGEGRIRIALKDEDLGEEFVEQHPGFRPGPYVCLQVEDNGKGMDEETRAKIFDPFFTTKFQGRGMGMAAVYGIVQNHNGLVRVESELGKGTVVRVWLPAIDVAPPESEPAGTETVTGTGTILIIEDEEVVIDVTKAMLEMLGYRVMVAKSGRDAVHIAETFDGRIDLALLDIKLPDMDGGKVYPLIMEARPNLKVIVCSGYSIDGPAREIVDAGAQGFLQKPVSVSTLSEKVKEILENNP